MVTPINPGETWGDIRDKINANDDELDSGKLKTELVWSENADNFTETGFYEVGGLEGTPGDINGGLMVGVVGSQIYQLFFEHITVYVRRYDGSAWSNWVELATTASVTELKNQITTLEARVQQLEEQIAQITGGQ